MSMKDASFRRLTGKCLCGAIEFEFVADRNDVTACHCGQCRAWSGHYWASVNAPFATFKVTKGEASLAWRRSSSYARRGFCGACGSALFWQADRLDDHKHRIAIAAGALTAPTGLQLKEHIFVADKGDYYQIADGLTQKEKF